MIGRFQEQIRSSKYRFENRLKQNRCHWRMGSHYLDQADAPNRFSNWHCGEENQPTPPVTITTISENVTSPTQPTTSQQTTKSTHAHPV